MVNQILFFLVNSLLYFDFFRNKSLILFLSVLLGCVHACDVCGHAWVVVSHLSHFTLFTKCISVVA